MSPDSMAHFPLPVPQSKHFWVISGIWCETSSRLQDKEHDLMHQQLSILFICIMKKNVFWSVVSTSKAWFKYSLCFQYRSRPYLLGPLFGTFCHFHGLGPSLTDCCSLLCLSSPILPTTNPISGPGLVPPNDTWQPGCPLSLFYRCSKSP